jgi:hypothetical protein
MRRVLELLKNNREDNYVDRAEEEPGALLEMPINIEHEVTKIGHDERPKYSLVLSWGYR